MLNRYFLATVVVVFLLANDALAQDWPHWRGVERDGVIAKPITPADGEPELAWTAEIAGGYSGPTVANGKVYVMDRITDPNQICLLYTSPSPRDRTRSRMPSSA